MSEVEMTETRKETGTARGSTRSRKKGTLKAGLQKNVLDHYLHKPKDKESQELLKVIDEQLFPDA